jgi:hypothetical protein
MMRIEHENPPPDPAPTIRPKLETGPPPEVLQELDAAWERARAPFEEGPAIQLETDHARRRATGESGYAIFVRQVPVAV